MANQLRMATVQTILTLRRRRWSYRRIARELGIHRETVARYVRLDREGVILPHVPPGSGPSKPANAPPRVGWVKTGQSARRVIGPNQ